MYEVDIINEITDNSNEFYIINNICHTLAQQGAILSNLLGGPQFDSLHSKNRPVWCDVEYHKRFKYVFLIINWFWGEMAQFTVRQMVLEPRSWVRVTRVSLWGRDCCWGGHNLTPYNHSKNKPVWCDVECHKRIECVFLMINWFWGEMAQLTVQHN